MNPRPAPLNGILDQHEAVTLAPTQCPTCSACDTTVAACVKDFVYLWCAACSHLWSIPRAQIQKGDARS